MGVVDDSEVADPTPVEVERDRAKTGLVETRKLGPLVVKDSSSSPYFEVIVNSTSTQLAPLDLGADVSLISAEFYEELKSSNPEMRLIENCAKLWTVGGGGLKVYGRCWVSLKFGQVELTHPVYVCKTSIPLLVGADVLWRLGCLVDLVNGVLWSGYSEPTPFTDSWKGVRTVQTTPQMCDLEVVEAVVVPSFTEAQRVLVKLCKGQDIGEKDATVLASERLRAMGLEILDCVISTKKRWSWVFVRNATGQDVFLPKYKRIGFALAIDSPSFSADISVLGDIAGPSARDQASYGMGFPRTEADRGQFSIRRVEGPNGVPLGREDVVECKATEGGLHLLLRHDGGPSQEEHAKEPGADSLVDDHLEKLEIGTDRGCLDLMEEIDAAVAKADALNSQEKSELKELLVEFKDIFARGKYDAGLTSLHEVVIPSASATETPSYTKQYKIPHASHESVSKIIAELEEKGLIRPCNSAYNSPVWPVLKSNGTWRLCIDFRNLNKRIPISRWPMPNIDEALASITKSKYFSTLDAANGFWTIPVNKSDQHKLAFTFANRQYTWTRMPFGYANSPAEWNIFLSKVLPDARTKNTLSFVDDVLAHSEEWKYHLSQLRYVLENFRRAGIKVSPKKCQWGRSGVDFLGYHVTRDGISPQRCKVEAIMNVPEPQNVRQLKHFLGMISFSRKFIQSFAQIAEPLNRLLRKGVEWRFEEKERQALETLKTQLCEAPVLGFPQFGNGQEFIVETAYSVGSLSAMLSQVQGNQTRVIAYASKSLNCTEQGYSECEKSCYAATWALLHFRPYLCGHHVVIKTSHHPVTFLNHRKETTGLTGKVARWALILQDQSMEVQYAKNRSTKHVQGLADMHDCGEVISEPEVGQDLSPCCNRKWDADLCKDIPKVFADGSSAKNEEGKKVAGVGVCWRPAEIAPPQCKYLGEKSSQYAELAAAYLAVEQAVGLRLTEVVVCSDSSYVCNIFLDYLAKWKKTSMKNARGNPVKHEKLICAIDNLITDNGLVVY